MSIDPAAVLALMSDLTNRLAAAEHECAQLRAALVEQTQATSTKNDSQDDR